MYKTLTTALRALENKPVSLRSCNGFPLARFAGLPPQAVAEQPVLMVVRLMKRCFADLYCPTAPRGEGGAVRHQRGESHRRWLIDVMLFMPYDIESQSRNADFILIARRAIPQPSA